MASLPGRGNESKRTAVLRFARVGFRGFPGLQLRGLEPVASTLHVDT